MDTIKLLGFIALITIGFLTLVGFNVAGADTTGPNPEGVTWVLNSYGDEGNLIQALPDKEVTLTFNEDKSLGGNSGVNLYGGEYMIDGTKIAIGNLMSTEMAGPEPLMNQESTFLKILQSAESFDMEGQTLTITGTEGVLVFLQK